MTTTSEQDAYHELTYYTLAHGDPSFIHQHVVDAFTAQNADERTKPIAIIFALVGLYLYLERNFSGKQVQRAHMQLAKKRKKWMNFPMPAQQATVNVFDVLAASASQERDAKIRIWCAAVWETWKDSHQQVRDLVKAELGI